MKAFMYYVMIMNQCVGYTKCRYCKYKQIVDQDPTLACLNIQCPFDSALYLSVLGIDIKCTANCKDCQFKNHNLERWPKCNISIMVCNSNERHK